MAARTALTPVQLVADNGTSEGSGTSVAGLVSAGATVASGGSSPGPFRLVLIANNTAGTSQNVIVRASRSGVDANGNTQTNLPQNTVFTHATLGDLTVAVAASGTQVIPIQDTDRFTQDDGSMSIDFSGGFTGTIWVLRLPFVNPS